MSEPAPSPAPPPGERDPSSSGQADAGQASAPAAPPQPDGGAEAPPPGRRRLPAAARVGLLVLLLAGLWVLGKVTGVTDSLDAERVRAVVGDTGALGVLLYVAIFTGGELVHVPGFVFVGAAVLAWGGAYGYLVALLASVASVATSFVIVRAVGGRALATVQRPFVRRMLAHLDERPIRTIVVLRLILWLAPPLNYALAMTHVRFRDYMIGSLLGLALPVAGMCLVFELLFGP